MMCRVCTGICAGTRMLVCVYVFPRRPPCRRCSCAWVSTWSVGFVALFCGLMVVLTVQVSVYSCTPVQGGRGNQLSFPPLHMTSVPRCPHAPPPTLFLRCVKTCPFFRFTLHVHPWPTEQNRYFSAGKPVGQRDWPTKRKETAFLGGQSESSHVFLSIIDTWETA